MTTLVVGGVLPAVPRRTPFTPPLPTAMWFWGAAETVPGSSTRMRAGELSLLTCGVTSSVELSSISMLSEPGVTFTCCNWLCALDAEAGFAAGAAAGLAAAAVDALADCDPGITAGFTAGAGAPGVGLSG